MLEHSSAQAWHAKPLTPGARAYDAKGFVDGATTPDDEDPPADEGLWDAEADTEAEVGPEEE